jgi:hypothetical protein
LQACRDILGMMEEHLILLSLKLAELQRETDSLRGLLQGSPADAGAGIVGQILLFFARRPAGAYPASERPSGIAVAEDSDPKNRISLTAKAGAGPRRGQVPHSRELATFISLMVGVVALYVLGRWGGHRMMDW